MNIFAYLMVLKGSALFYGIADTEISPMLDCLSVTVKNYEKNQYIHRMGDHTDSIGLVLSGHVHIVKEDFWGNRSIMAEIRTCGLFGEAYAISGKPLEVGVIATDAVQVMFFNSRKITETCTSACGFHAKLIQNLLKIVTEKTLMLTQKIEYLSKRSTREKLLSYLSAQALKKGRPFFDIPFNRTQLAEYLSIDRSAMTTELGRMRDEGLLTFDKNHFELKADIGGA